MQRNRSEMLKELINKNDGIYTSPKKDKQKDNNFDFEKLTGLFYDLADNDPRTIIKGLKYFNPIVIDVLKKTLYKDPHRFICSKNISVQDAKELQNKYQIKIPSELPEEYYYWFLLNYATYAGPDIQKRDKRRKPCSHYIDRPDYRSELKNKLDCSNKCIVIGLAGSGKSQLIRDFLSRDESLPSITKVCVISPDDDISSFHEVISKYTNIPFERDLPIVNNNGNVTSFFKLNCVMEYSEDFYFGEPDCLYIFHTSHLHEKFLQDIDAVQLHERSFLLVTADSADISIMGRIRKQQNNKSISGNSMEYIVLLHNDNEFLSKIYDKITLESHNPSYISLTDEQKQRLFCYCNNITLAVSTIACSLRDYSKKHTKEECQSQINRILDPYSGLFRTSGLPPVKDNYLNGNRYHSSDTAIKSFLRDKLIPILAEKTKLYSEQFVKITLFVRNSPVSISLIEYLVGDKKIHEAANELQSMNLATIDEATSIKISGIISDILWEACYHEDREYMETRYNRTDVTDSNLAPYINNFIRIFSGQDDTPNTVDTFSNYCDVAKTILIRIKKERPFVSQTNPKSKWSNVWSYYDQIRVLLKRNGDYLGSDEINELNYKAETKKGIKEYSSEEQKRLKELYHAQNETLSGVYNGDIINLFSDNENSFYYTNDFLFFFIDQQINKIDNYALSNNSEVLSPKKPSFQQLFDYIFLLTSCFRIYMKTSNNQDVILEDETLNWQTYYQCVLGFQKSLYCLSSDSDIPSPVYDALLFYKSQLLEIFRNDCLSDSLRIRVAADLYRYLGLWIIKFGTTDYINREEIVVEYKELIEWMKDIIDKRFVSFDALQAFNCSLIIFHVLSLEKENLLKSMKGIIKHNIENRYRPINEENFSNTIDIIDKFVQDFESSIKTNTE